jgi:hypothetical protein
MLFFLRMVSSILASNGCGIFIRPFQRLHLQMTTPGPFGNDIATPAVEVTYVSSNILRVRIYDDENDRWQGASKSSIFSLAKSLLGLRVVEWRAVLILLCVICST